MIRSSALLSSAPLCLLLCLLTGCPGGSGRGDSGFDGGLDGGLDAGQDAAIDSGDGGPTDDLGVDIDGGPDPDSAVPDMGEPAIVAHFDPEMEVLPQPISGPDTAALREAFSWADTEAWPEVDAAGKPALFYAIVYVTNADEYERLDRIGLHHWSLPLFEAERAQWAGRLGVVSPTGDGVGSFQFVVLSGSTFNALRNYALADEVPFQAIIRRAPPAEFEGPDGALDHAALFQAGFNLGSRGPDAAPEPMEKLTAFALAIIAARAAEDAWNDSLAALENEFRQDKIDLSMRARLMNTDPRFAPDGERTLMTRAWSSMLTGSFGTPLRMRNVEFVVGAGAGHLRSRADVNGVARFTLGRNTRYHVCMRAETHAVRVSELWVSIQVCDFGSEQARVFVDPPESRLYEFDIRDWRFNIVAQMTDAYDFSVERLSHIPSRPARVLVGPLADVFGSFNENRAFALCGGYGLTLQSIEFAAMVALVTAQFVLLPLPPEWVALLQVSFADLTFTALSFDIIFPNAPADPAVTSRGVPTHEYGHFLTCDLLRRAGIFDTAWAAVINLSLTVQQEPEVDILYVLEATADFLTSQIAGAANYYVADGAVGSTAVEETAFCTNGGDCLETNQGDMDPAIADFDQNLASTLTLMHDMFDGGERMETRVPWHQGPTHIEPGLGQARIDRNDEQITLPIFDLVNFFLRLGERAAFYDRRGFVGIWTGIMRDRGFSEGQICELFALHSFNGDCREWLADALIEGEVQPATPILVSHEVVDATGVRLAWRDISPLAEVFEVEWGPAGEAAMIDAVPWARAAEFSVADLAFDTRYVFGIRTVNGDLESRTIEVGEVTGAEPVDAVRVVDTVPAGVSLAWDATAATGYRVQVAQVLECDGDDDPVCVDSACAGGLCLGAPAQYLVDAPNVVLRELEPGADYEAVVIAENQNRVSAPPSPPVAFTAGIVAVLYVDPIGGDDNDSGQEDAPLATLAEALERAIAGTDVIRLTGAHVVPGAIELPVGVSLDGGWTRDRAGWMPSDNSARVTVQGAVRTFAGCGAANGNEAAIVAAGDLSLRNLIITIVDRPPVANTCRAGIANADGAVRLTNVFMAPAREGNGCIVGVDAVNSLVDLRDTHIVGNFGGADGGVTALCVAGGDSVQITDSVLTGVDGLRRADVSHLFGAKIRADRINVSRSVIQAAQQGRVVLDGNVVGLDAEPGEWLDMDNALVRTPAGGGINYAVEVRGSAGRLPLLRMAFSTLINGNADLPERRGANHQGAALRFPPDVQRVELINNAFVLGSSREGTLSVIDRRRGENPIEFTLRGNVAALRSAAAPDAAFVLCAPRDEFDRIDTVAGFDSGTHVCQPGNGRGIGWRVEDNHAFNGSHTRPALSVSGTGRLTGPGGAPQSRTDRMGVTRAGTTLPVEAFRLDVDRDPRVENAPGVGAVAPPAMCVPINWFIDSDHDGYGGNRLNQCEPPEDWSAVGGDCADNTSQRSPDVAESCNGIDDDCDGRADEGVTNACGRCGAVPADRCDGADNDCDGRVDELSGPDEAGGRRIDETFSTRESQTVNNRVNSTADIDHYRVFADESLSATFGCEGGCATANEQTRFRADLTVPADASGPFQLCVGTGDGPNAPFQCVNINPGQRRDLVVSMAGRNCCNGILCDQNNSTVFFATVRGQEACSNSTYRLALTTFEVCVD